MASPVVVKKVRSTPFGGGHRSSRIRLGLRTYNLSRSTNDDYQAQYRTGGPAGQTRRRQRVTDPMLGAEAGGKYDALLTRIVNLALQRHRCLIV